jgi:HD-like signal output (HDOD) protein
MKPSKEQFLIAIARIETFSAAPRILSRALTMLRDPESDLDSIATLVGSDSALAADIIRCANSAFYGSGGPRVQTIGQAVQKIGFRETIRRLNLTVSRITAGRNLDCYGIFADDFWAENLFNGLFLFALAEQTGAADPDEAYTVGLLRFIGRLAINQSIHDLGGGLFWVGEQRITEWELENVGFSQASAGALLLSKWQFPDEMVQAISGQDAPATLPAPNWLADALYFTSAMLPQGAGAPFDASLAAPVTTPPIGSDFMHRNGLSAEIVEKLMGKTRKNFEEVRKSFGGRN